MTQPTQKTAARILVVDDDEDFRPALEMGLEDRGFTVTCANGPEAAVKLLAERTFDAVVSDIQMPGMNGIQLLKWIKEHHPLPVILMTGFTEMAETLEAAQCGATGFLSKPFKHEDLVAALAACFPSGEEGKDLDTEYCRIAIEEFVSGSDIKYDIYIRLTSSKYVKIAHSGQDIAIAKIRAYKAQGIHQLYLTKPDFRSYAKFNINLSRMVAPKPDIAREKKIVILRHSAELISSLGFADSLDHESVQDAKSIVESALSVLLDYPDVLQLMSLLKSHAEPVHSHCVAVSFTCALIAKGMGWTSAANQFKLSAAALFHDVGKKELPRELLYKAKKSHTDEERKVYECHADRGAKLLAQLKELPGDISEIVAHHHENCVGFGFPGRLRRDKIHPLARVLAVADVFCNHVMGGPDGPACRPDQAIGRMLTFNAEYYDAEAALGLMKAFNYPVPDRFVEELRWRQRAS